MWLIVQVAQVSKLNAWCHYTYVCVAIYVYIHVQYMYMANIQ